MKTLAELHAEVTARLQELDEALEAVVQAVDAAAAVAETDPALTGYVEAILPLLDVALPPLPQLPSA